MLRDRGALSDPTARICHMQICEPRVLASKFRGCTRSHLFEQGGTVDQTEKPAIGVDPGDEFAFAGQNSFYPLCGIHVGVVRHVTLLVSGPNQPHKSVPIEPGSVLPWTALAQLHPAFRVPGGRR